MQQVIQTLAEYIKEQYNAQLDTQENIFDSGIIDSLGFVDLIGFISQAFEIEFEPCPERPWIDKRCGHECKDPDSKDEPLKQLMLHTRQSAGRKQQNKKWAGLRRAS